MTQKEFFGNAVWLGAEEYPVTELEKGETSHFPILRSELSLPEDCEIIKATLRAVGLGYFYCLFNGERVTEDEYLPLATDYEPRNDYPTDESLAGHRIYVPEFDVTDKICRGKNSIVIHCGGGWYTFGYKPGLEWGDAKAIWSLTVETDVGTVKYYSAPENTRVLPSSFIKNYHFTKHERQDYRDFDFSIFEKDFSGDYLPKAAAVRPLSDKTVYSMTDCPADRVMKRLTVEKTAEEGSVSHYDAGENTSGYPILRITAPRGESVRVIFSEELNPDGTVNRAFSHSQEFTVVSDGSERTVRPLFAWFGFRCFSVEGRAEVLGVNTVYADVGRASEFECDNETLNWLYNAFMNTQSCNMHGGIPSDCPHLERLGYTGDGQLTCDTVMTVFDSRKFYLKWLYDIMDCQDTVTGHVQYTAPYYRCGGGPGGWGSAIVELPYRYYQHYGNLEILKEFYPCMLRYFDYLEAHSENGLVISDKEGQWCLGDWAAPTSIILPAPFVNNYFYVKSLTKAAEIAALIKKEEDAEMLLGRAEEKKRVMTNAYYNKWDGNFLGNRQGANAFAVDIGIGDERTYKNLVEYYRRTRSYDTGIFGTQLVTRVLFEGGDGDVAVDLLTSRNDLHTFDAMRQRGATTVWEYFPGSLRDRSHSHPMFGAVVGCLFEYILGIKCLSQGSEIIVSPRLRHSLNRVSGGLKLPRGGGVKVSYERSKDGVTAELCVTVTDGVNARLCCGEVDACLVPGENRFTLTV